MLILTGAVASAATPQTTSLATIKPVSALVAEAASGSTDQISATATASTANDSENLDTTITTQPLPTLVQTLATSATTTGYLIPTNDMVKAAVAKYFANQPLLQKIAMCESRYRQFSTDGSVFRGIVNNKDVGVMQINEKYHAKRALSLGIDIYSLEGNMEYAKILYKESGSQPWISSSPCWGKYVNTSSVAMK